MSDAALLRRAGDLEGELVAFSHQPRYDRAVSSFLAEYGDGLEDADEQRWMLLWDCFVLEHRLANGGTVVEQFVEARPDLPEVEREMVLGWRDVVQGPFEVQRRDGPALVVENLVDDLTYRVRSNMGRGRVEQMPRRSFIIARLVAVGDEWMLERAGTDPARERTGHRLSARAGHVFAYAGSGVPEPGQGCTGVGTPAC